MGRSSTLFLVVSILVVVLATLFSTSENKQKHTVSSPTTLISSALSGEISRFSIEQGKDIITFSTQKRHWVIPSQGNFPADKNKINLFLSELFKLSTQTQVSNNINDYSRYGVTKEAVAKGTACITLYNKANEEISKTFIANAKNHNTPSNKQTGQYLHQFASNHTGIYYTEKPIEINTKPSYWFRSKFFEIENSKLKNIKLCSIKIRNLDSEGSLNNNALKLQNCHISEEPEILTQSGNSFKHLQGKAVTHKGKDLEFTSLYTLTLSNALVYKIFSTNKDNDTFLKISVSSSNSDSKTKELATNLRARYKGWVFKLNKAYEKHFQQLALLIEKSEKKEAERNAKRLAELKAKKAAEQKAKEEAEQKAKEEAKRNAKLLAELKAKKAAEQKTKLLAEQKAKQEAEKKAKEEAKRNAKLLAKQKALEEQIVTGKPIKKIEADQQTTKAAALRAAREAAALKIAKEAAALRAAREAAK